MTTVYPDPPGCGFGFMSVERMRYLLSVETASLIRSGQRQQISPEMRFTCDGIITKWIIGATYDGTDGLFPELQIWRNIGDEKFKKINGTFIELTTVLSSEVYEYGNFSPIPVKSGDVMGIFLPPFFSFRLWYEAAINPIQYHLLTDSSALSSPCDEIDLEHDFVVTGRYQPMVAVGFGKYL